MSILRDLLDIFKDIDAHGTAEEYFRKKKYSSISRRASEGTLQFPVLVSRTLDIETLQLITKALERQYASFTQIALSMSPTLNINTEKDPIGYLRKFHQNTDVKSGFNDLTNAVVDLAENYNCFTNEDDTRIMFTAVYDGATGKLVADNKEQLQSLLEFVRMDKLNDKFTPKKEAIYRFANEGLSQYHNSMLPVKEDSQNNAGGSLDYSTNKISGDAKIYNNINIGKNDSMSKKSSLRDMDIKTADNILKDNDVKKSNELVPTTLHIRVKMINKNGEDVGFLDFIIGVKATMHPIKSEEMIVNVVSACKNNNKFFDFIRWTTGEISFFKDFVFNMKEIKDDVTSRSKGSSPWWIALKRRKALAKIKGAVMLPNQILPNTTIVLSMEEVEFIKSEYGYDLMNPVFVDKIMSTFFLLGFVVVDNSTQIAHFLFDGQKNYQSVTFSALEKENSSDERKFKEMLKVINRN